MRTIFIPFIFLFLVCINPVISFAQTADAGSDQEVCTDQAIMDAAAAPIGFTGSWSILSGSCVFDDITSHNTLVRFLLEGDNVLRWTITDGSVSDHDDVIITNNYPTQALTAADEEVCQTTYTINANIHSSEEFGFWRLISGSGTIVDPTDNSTEVTGLSTGINTFEWTITKGICISSDEITITNNTIIATAGSDQVICEDYSSLTADDPAPGIGYWSIIASSGSPVFSNPNSHITDITGLGNNTNAIQWTVQNGICSDYDIVIITSNKPTQADAGPDQIACDNHTYLSGNNPTNESGEWSLVSGAGSFVSVTEYNTQVTNIDIGSNIYKWTITNKGCTSEDNVEVYYDYYTADAGLDDAICGDSYTLNGNNPLPGTGEWRVTGGSGTFTDPNIFNTLVTDMAEGDNTYEWNITRGNCVQTDYVIITRNSASGADAGTDKETCDGNTTMSAVNPAIGTGTWSVVSGSGIFADSNLNTTTVSNVGLGTNVYRWTVTHTICSNFDDVIVTNNDVSADAGSDQIVCGTSSVLAGNQPQAGEFGEWQILAGTSTVVNINLYNSTVINLSSGLNNYRWTISKGSCSDFDDVEIINNEYFASASVSGPSDVCEDYSPILGNSPPSGGTGTWSVVFGSGVFDNSNDQSTVVRGLSVGVNIIRWTITKAGCSNSDDITINRNTVFADAGEDQILCSVNAVLSGNELINNDTGLWTKVSGTGTIENPTNNITNVYGLNFGINTFMWTVSGNGCEDSDNVLVINNSFITSAGSNQQICSSSTNLTASDPTPGFGFWEVISGTGVFSDPSNHNTIVSGIPDISTNIYKWTVHKNGCTDSDEVTIQNNQVHADAGLDFATCINNAVLNGNDPSPGIGVWTIQVGGGVLADENLYNSEITGMSPNQNIIRWTVTYLTCETYDEVTITNNTVSATAGPDQSTCEDQTQLSGQQPPSGGTGLWEIISGYGEFQDPNLYNTQVNNLSPGLSTFRWTVFNNGCNSGGDEVTVNNKSFDADAGADQQLDDFVTSTFLDATLPLGGTGSWILLAGGGNIVSPNDPNTEVTDLPTGINVFQWTVNFNGCTSYDAVNIITLDFLANAGADKTICLDSTKLNAANAGGTPEIWSVIAGSGDFEDPYQNDTWVHNVSEGINIFRWSVTINGATAYDDIEIIRVNSHAGIDQIICTDHTVLNGNIPQYSQGIWSLAGGSATIVNPTAYNTEVTNIGLYSNLFSWTLYTNNCNVSDYVIIHNDQIAAYAGEDQEIYESSTFLNAVLPPDASVFWSVVSGNGVFADNTDPQTEVTNLSEGDNIFRWNVSNTNCSDFDDITVTYIIENPITTENIDFSFKIYPNPVEDVLLIEKTGIEDFDLRIYDIFGKLIYTEKEISSDSHKINFSVFPRGTYFINTYKNDNINTFKIVKM